MSVNQCVIQIFELLQKIRILQLYNKDPYSCTTIAPELYDHSLYSCTTAAIRLYNYRSFVLQRVWNTI